MSNYIGNKGGQSILPILTNLIPCSHRYFSLFFGAGGLEKSKPFSNIKWVCSEINPSNKKYTTPLANIVYSSYQELIADNNFTSEDFIFADPPYVLSTRLSGKKLYKFEFDEQSHVEFLTSVSNLPAKILITHPVHDLYNSHLTSWFKLPMRYQTRKGIYNDCVWMNYDVSSIELHNYNFLGKDFTERQQIKRKRHNIINRIESLSYHEKMAILKHFQVH
jgi:DNA adenine methylase